MPELFEDWIAARPGLAELAAVDGAEQERFPQFLYEMCARLKLGLVLTERQEAAAAGAWRRWKEARRRARQT